MSSLYEGNWYLFQVASLDSIKGRSYILQLHELGKHINIG